MHKAGGGGGRVMGPSPVVYHPGRMAHTHAYTQALTFTPLFENVTLQNSRDAASNTWASSASRATVFLCMTEDASSPCACMDSMLEMRIYATGRCK